jgi:hypothetical protein
VVILGCGACHIQGGVTRAPQLVSREHTSPAWGSLFQVRVLRCFCPPHLFHAEDRTSVLRSSVAPIYFLLSKTTQHPSDHWHALRHLDLRGQNSPPCWVFLKEKENSQNHENWVLCSWRSSVSAFYCCPSLHGTASCWTPTPPEAHSSRTPSACSLADYKKLPEGGGHRTTESKMKRLTLSQAPVTQTSNPSYLGGWDREDCGRQIVQEISSSM